MNFANAEPETLVALDHETFFIGTAESTVCQYSIVDLRLNGAELPELEGASLDLLNFPGCADINQLVVSVRPSTPFPPTSLEEKMILAGGAEIAEGIGRNRPKGILAKLIGNADPIVRGEGPPFIPRRGGSAAT